MSLKNKVHRINLHIVAAVYPLLHEAIKDLKPREKAELIRKLAELALILLAERKNRKPEDRVAADPKIDSPNAEMDHDITSLFNL